MSMTAADASPLFALMARQWRLDAEVQACAFAHDGGSLAFALADGTLASVSMDDPEAAGTRWRMSIEDGRSTISPRARPVLAPARVPVGEGALRLVPFGRSGFLVGGATGRLVRIEADGSAEVVVEYDSTGVEAIAATRAGTMGDGAAWVAASGCVTRYAPDGGTARAMACYEGIARVVAPTPDSGRVALGFEASLSIVDLRDASSDRFEIAVGPVEALSWSPDGCRLAAGLLDGGVALIDMADRRVLRLPDYPAAVRTLDWSPDSRRLVTSGAFRTIVWTIDEGRERPRTIGTGRSGFVAVEAARLHPHLSLVAAGYENGMIVITAIGHPDELVIRDPAPGSLRDLSWSADGEHLAFHAAEGWVGVIDLPAHMFKQIDRRIA
ncbi:WD40 repeat domain-containing protein [Ancylobacter sonchi]|uniref:WD40 repeat domain-containing protein n=1 Tax=Ancylobacter sonchi TaxID=1937790 RepID=UPI001BD360A7|nr:WD40 repeat domain-containing protein [Ancylobacter sonchi]MBS7532701.1 WD40 repeat domain-containing protein [Ancylobacter sonchi]